MTFVTRDGFAAETPITFGQNLLRVMFALENRTGDRPASVLAIALPSTSDRWEVRVDGRRVGVKPHASTDYFLLVGISMGTGPANVEMIRR